MKVKRAEKGRQSSLFRLPLFGMTSNAGDPPADPHVEERLDIAELLIVRPDDTFFVQVEGEVSDDASIHAGDILVVDRAAKPRRGDTVVARLDGDLTIRVLPKSLRLVSPAPAVPLEVWGVVLWVIHKAR